MSSIDKQSLDLTVHHDVYDDIDPNGSLRGSTEGKVLFVTGASRGIGQQTAVSFAEAGARAIYATARSKVGLEETRELVAEANPDTEFAMSSTDVTSAAQVERAVEDCVARFGAIDVADANAGYLGPWVKIAESDPEGWWQNFEVNVQGAYHVARYTIPHLAKSASAHEAKSSSGGHLIIVSSVGAQLLVGGASDYQTSKHAVNRLVEFVQTDHGDEGLKCFALHPGGVATEVGKAMPDYMHEYLNDDPSLAAGFKVWLASGRADWAKGRYLSANWDVGELEGLKDEILNDDLLVNRLRVRW